MRLQIKPTFEIILQNMELEELKQKRKEFLEDTCRYYSEDVSRRAIEMHPIYLEYRCRYKTSDGKKCAIGRHIPDEKYDTDIEGFGINKKLVSLIPEKIIDLGTDFLSKIQLFHDCNDNWNENGLSGHGQVVFRQIEKEFCL